MTLLHQQASKEAFRFLQTWIFGIWLGIMLWDPLPDLAQYPTAGYTPTGLLLKMLPESMTPLIFSSPFLWGIKIGIIAVCLLIIVNRFKKFAGVIAVILLSLYQGIIRSFGHINHPEMMLLHSVLILTVFFFFEEKLDKVGFLDQAKKISVYSIPFILILFFFSFTYVFAGIHRIFFGGIDVFTNDSLIYWVVENARRSRLINWNLDWIILDFPWVAFIMKIGMALTTLAEIMAPFCLVSKWIRYAFLVIILPFHVFVWLFMGIMFWENVMLFILFFDFTPFFKKSVK